MTRGITASVTLSSFLVLLCNSVFALNDRSPRNDEPNQPAYLKMISPEKLKEDLKFLFKTIEGVHPNMYAYTRKPEFEPTKSELYDKATSSLTVREFYKEVARAITSLQFGHCLVLPPGLQETFTESRILPFTLRWDEECVIVLHDFTEQGLEGSVLLEVDGRQIEDLIAEYRMYVPHEGDIGNTAYATRAIGYFLWLEHGEKDWYSLVIQKENGQKLTYRAKTVEYKTMAAGKSVEQSIKQKENFSYRYLKDSNVGVLAVTSFAENLRSEFSEFLKSTFRKIKEQDVSHIIIDMRENGGGDSQLGGDLLNYLTEKPHRQFDKCIRKLSKQFMDLNRLDGKKVGDLKTGEIFEEDFPLSKPGENPLRYYGGIYVLIGNGTFSSGQSFAATVKCFEIGTLVGQETGGTTTEYGDVLSFTMPNSGLMFAVPCACFVEACSKGDGRGVIPDYEVKQKPEDTAKGVDTVLQFTLNLIKN